MNRIENIYIYVMTLVLLGMCMARQRPRRQFSLEPLTIKRLEALSRLMNKPMSRLIDEFVNSLYFDILKRLWKNSEYQEALREVLEILRNDPDKKWLYLDLLKARELMKIGGENYGSA